MARSLLDKLRTGASISLFSQALLASSPDATDPAAFILQIEQDAPLQATRANARHYGQPWILVGIRSQSLILFDEWGRQQQHYIVSTARRGAGEQANSYQTPRGWHHVCEKLGAGAEPNTIIFRRRVTPWKYTSELHQQYPEKDWILTRILWLCGDEAGRNQGGNVDSYDRAIYLHGAGDHVAFGTPTSLGCVRMKNPDIIQLFDQTPNGIDILIDENS
jgi:hypothetical protein